MISRCANPACTATFRYLHEGRVHRIVSDPHGPDEWRREAPHFHYFWLCDGCAPKFRLGYSREEGVYLEAVGGGAHIPVAPPESVEPHLRGQHAIV